MKKRKHFTRVCLQFRELVHAHCGWVHGMSPGQQLTRKLEAENKRLGLAWSFQTSKPTLSATPPPTWPYPLLLPTDSTAWAQIIEIYESMVAILIQNITEPLPRMVGIHLVLVRRYCSLWPQESNQVPISNYRAQWSLYQSGRPE